MAISGTQVRTSVHVAARSYVYIANEINRIFLESIQSAGLDPTAYVEIQQTIENGLRTWITMQYLEAAHLEIVERGTQVVRSRIDLGLSYVQNPSDDRYSTDIDRVRGALAGTPKMFGCEYRVVVTLKDGAPDVSGWGPTSLGSVDHLQRQDVGEVVNTGGGRLQMYRFL
ncbi:hypothetical protein GCM10009681_07300 [Luedemannella helvata]|uniref:Bacterial HORMA domain-containing protein n=1 Tax=Luedemannella helvata TaxID=349315 RepID=A0ABN2JU48_9ACTN